MEVDEGTEMMEVDECTTPKSPECRIPVSCVCPPPPKKKSVIGEKRDPPKGGYFQSPDLDAMLSIPARRREACA